MTAAEAPHAAAQSAPPAPPRPPRDSLAIPDSAWLEIHIVDVGQGDAIWIRTWNDGVAGNGRFDGRNITIDGGPNGSDGSNSFLKYIRERARPDTRFDAVIISHPHDDHYPGALGVLRHYEACSYYDGDTPNGSRFNQFLGTVRAERCNGQPIELRRGRAAFGSPDWGAELRAELLWGAPIDPTGMGSGGTLINNGSLVLKLTYGTQSFLFMGDAEGKERGDPPDTPRYAEARLLSDSVTESRLKSTVLKIAHHGSETSSTLPFIRAVDPEVVIVSSGREAYSGTFLPDRSTLQRYCAHNSQIRIYRTDQNDAAEGRTAATDNDGDHIVIRTNGRRTEIRALSAGQPWTAPACTP